MLSNRIISRKGKKNTRSSPQTQKKAFEKIQYSLMTNTLKKVGIESTNSGNSCEVRGTIVVPTGLLPSLLTPAVSSGGSQNHSHSGLPE